MKKELFSEDRDLVKLLSKANVNHLEVFSKIDFGPKRSKMTRLFELMRDNEFDNADEIKSALYGVEKKADGNFLRMYHTFREKLVNTLFFIDTNSALFTERAKAYYVCSRRTVLIRILIERGIRKRAINLAEQTIRKTIKYEFTELTILLSKLLMRQYSGALVNFKNFNKFRLIFNKTFESYYQELSTEEVMCSVLFRRNSGRPNANNKQTLKNIQTVVSEVSKIIHKNPTIEFIVNASVIIMDYYLETRNFIKYKEWTTIFLKKLFAKPFISLVTLEFLILDQLRIATITKDKLVASDLYKNYFNKINEGNFNWYLIYKNYILTLIHCKSYLEAWEKFQYVLSYKSFKKQLEVIKENFLIVQPYFHLLIMFGKINVNIKFNEFRTNKFLNQVPEFSKNKQGTNIPIILAHILLLFVDKKYSKIIDRIESLNLYSYRHLKKDENFRSYCFIKMISEMVRADFKKQGTLFRTEKLFNKLKAVPIDTYPDTAETEIIPYEDLWEMVIERLD